MELTKVKTKLNTKSLSLIIDDSFIEKIKVGEKTAFRVPNGARNRWSFFSAPDHKIVTENGVVYIANGYLSLISPAHFNIHSSAEPVTFSFKHVLEVNHGVSVGVGGSHLNFNQMTDGNEFPKFSDFSPEVQDVISEAIGGVTINLRHESLLSAPASLLSSWRSIVHDARPHLHIAMLQGVELSTEMTYVPSTEIFTNKTCSGIDIAAFNNITMYRLSGFKLVEALHKVFNLNLIHDQLHFTKCTFVAPSEEVAQFLGQICIAISEKNPNIDVVFNGCKIITSEGKPVKLIGKIEMGGKGATQFIKSIKHMIKANDQSNIDLSWYARDK